MMKFLCRLLLYVGPFLLFGAPFFAAGTMSGEIFDFDSLIAMQSESEEKLVGMAYNEQTAYYKLKNANVRKADVLALGTSRVMQFREEYFGTSFYNCGGCVKGHYNEYINFMENMDEDALPKYLIVGLDAWNFNAETQRHEDIYDSYQQIVKSDKSKLSIVKRVGVDYFRGKWKISDLFHKYDNIGFNGIIYGDGFRRDGSYFQREMITNPQNSEDYEYKDTFERIETGTAGYEHGGGVNAETLQCLEMFLAFCEERDIRVITFLPPYAPSVYDRMEETGEYGYIGEIEPAVKALCDKYDCEVYDFTDIRKLGCDDSYFIDGFHGGEVAYAMMLREMCREDSRLSEVTDIEKLENRIDTRFSNKLFVEPE